jgi:ubiquinone/menaquinone biosynthesis C-methylase UbiE
MNEIVKDYWDRRSSEYASSYQKYLDEEISLLKNIYAGYLPEQTSLNVLDIGTGHGIQAIAFRELGHKVTALDFSAGMLERASNEAGKRHLEINFVQGDAQNLPFEDASFDVVTSRYILWTLTNHTKFFDECRRVLCNGGTFFAIDGEWYKQTAADDTASPNEVLCQMPLHRGNTPEKVSEYLLASGFDYISRKDVRELGLFMEKYDLERYKEHNSSAVPYVISAVKKD